MTGVPAQRPLPCVSRGAGALLMSQLASPPLRYLGPWDPGTRVGSERSPHLAPQRACVLLTVTGLLSGEGPGVRGPSLLLTAAVRATSSPTRPPRAALGLEGAWVLLPGLCAQREPLPNHTGPGSRLPASTATPRFWVHEGLPLLLGVPGELHHQTEGIGVVLCFVL